MIPILTTAVSAILLFHLFGFYLLVRSKKSINRWHTDKSALSPASSDLPLLAIIIPARNEEKDIRDCIESLLKQDYPKHSIIVINDHSQDATGVILDQIVAEYPEGTLKVIHDPEPQDGWLGKHNALQAGVDNSTSELILFTDADVIFHDRQCLKKCVNELRACKSDLLSVLPRFDYKGLCETLVVPLYVGGMAFLMGPAVNSPQSRQALAAGAFILMKRSSFHEIDGLAPIKNAILDDVELARQFKSSGKIVNLRSGNDMMHVRLFKDFRHAINGPTKHLVGYYQKSQWMIPLAALSPSIIYGSLIFGIVRGAAEQSASLLTISLLSLAINYLAVFYMRDMHRFPILPALAIPLVSIQFAIGGLKAWIDIRFKNQVSWRGRNSQIK